MRPLTLKRIPSLARLTTMKRRARRSGRFVQLLLNEERDMLPQGAREARTIYDIRADTHLGHRVDRVIVRRRDGTRQILKDRFPEARP